MSSNTKRHIWYTYKTHRKNPFGYYSGELHKRQGDFNLLNEGFMHCKLCNSLFRILLEWFGLGKHFDEWEELEIFGDRSSRRMSAGSESTGRWSVAQVSVDNSRGKFTSVKTLKKEGLTLGKVNWIWFAEQKFDVTGTNCKWNEEDGTFPCVPFTPGVFSRITPERCIIIIIAASLKESVPRRRCRKI